MTATEEIHERAHDAPGEIVATTGPTLLGKLAAAASAIETLEKDGTNTFHHYNYTSIEGVVKAVRGELLSRGILIVPGLDMIDERERQTNQGVSTISTVHLVFTIYDVESRETLVVPWAGRGDDPADKGFAKGVSDARKTFLISLLNLARGEDTEADEATDQRTYGRAPETTNLIEQARGLSNEQLNAVLKAAGLSTAQSPFGYFARVPNEYAARLRELLAQIRG